MMVRMGKYLLIFISICLLGNLSIGRTPTWLKDIRPKSLPAFVQEEDPDVVLLRDEQKTVISTRGIFKTTLSQAILIRHKDGFDAAKARIPYYSDTSKIISFNAWVVPAKGKVLTFRKNDVVDAISSGFQNIVTTARTRSLDASRNVRVGSIFAFEAVVENKDIFSQDVWYFQGPNPSLNSGISYEFPEGWDILPTFFNMEPLAPIEKKVKKNRLLIWRLTSLGGIERQPYSPTLSELAKWAAFNIQAPPSSKRRLYRSWKEISEHRTPVYDSLSVVSPEMEKKVNELTADSANSLDMIRTLSEMAQSINYISVALDLGKGGGYRPRPSDEVFRTKYGDCKDKTNLLQGLLKVKGIDLYPLIVYSGKNKIFEEWPSSSQFNHCVAAIKVDGSFASPATIEHAELGKLLVFDPTSTFTPFGDIPYSLQGSKGMLLAGENGGLVSIPQLPLEKSLLKREIELNLLRDGTAIGKIVENSTGQAGRKERSYSFTKDSDYLQKVKDWIANYNPGAVIGDPIREDDRATGKFTMKVEFVAPGFAKNMRNVLLIFKPVILDRKTIHPFGQDDRIQPVDLYPLNLEERIKITLPENFEISEMPDHVFLEEDFGTYSLNLEHTGNTLIAHRSIKMNPVRVPIDRYDELISFYKQRIKADQSTVVLERL